MSGTSLSFANDQNSYTIGTTRNIVVTPSACVTDNRVTLDAIAKLGANARGVAVIHPGATDAELKALADGGEQLAPPE